MHRKTITVTDEMEAFIRSRVDSGDYGNDSEYMRDLVRRDLERKRAEERLGELINEGIASGVSERSVEEIWEAVKARQAAANA